LGAPVLHFYVLEVVAAWMSCENVTIMLTQTQLCFAVFLFAKLSLGVPQVLAESTYDPLTVTTDDFAEVAVLM